MSDAFARVQPGDPMRIPAEAYNAMLDAAKAHRSRALVQAGSAWTGGQDGVCVRVKNIGDALIERYDAVHFHFGNLLREDGEILLVGKKPGTQTTEYDDQWGIAQEPIPDGEIGRMMIAGITPARVTLLSYNHRYVDLRKIDGVWQLATTERGVGGILWHASDSGQPWRIVLIRFPHVSPSTIRQARLLETLNTNDYLASARAHVLDASGWTPVDSIVVYPPWRSHLGVILRDMTVTVAYNDDTGRHVVIAGGKARKLLVRATRAFAHYETSVPMQIVDWDDGEPPVRDNSALYVHNEFGFYGDAFSLWVAEYWPHHDVYWLYQGTCPVV